MGEVINMRKAARMNGVARRKILRCLRAGEPVYKKGLYGLLWCQKCRYQPEAHERARREEFGGDD